MALKQFIVTPSMGKRLIARAMVRHPAVQAAVADGTLAIVAGTTNGYVAEEILTGLGQGEGFTRKGFRRGAIVPADFGGLANTPPATDVIISDGRWQQGKTIFDVADSLGAGDVILKGGNALDVQRRRAGVYIGHPQCGTAGAAIRAGAGRRATMIVPIGLEKRVPGDLNELADKVNSPDASGPRLLVLPGRAFCELDAIELLAGAAADIVAAGGVHGAEGCVCLAVAGDNAQLAAAAELLDSLASEPPCQA